MSVVEKGKKGQKARKMAPLSLRMIERRQHPLCRHRNGLARLGQSIDGGAAATNVLSGVSDNYFTAKVRVRAATSTGVS